MATNPFAGDRGSWQSRTLSTGCSHAGAYSYDEPYSVLERRHLRAAHRNYVSYGLKILWVENFVGGKFHDLLVSHENNENWYPIKITRYKVVPITEADGMH